jgi:hypothetical protein
MSEKRIAPSKPNRRIGCSVHQLEKAALLGPERAIFGEIAPRLAHQPHRRRIAPLALQHGEQRTVGRGDRGGGADDRRLHIYPNEEDSKESVEECRAKEWGVYCRAAKLPTA